MEDDAPPPGSWGQLDPQTAPAQSFEQALVQGQVEIADGARKLGCERIEGAVAQRHVASAVSNRFEAVFAEDSHRLLPESRAPGPLTCSVAGEQAEAVAEVEAMMRKHLDTTLAEASARLKGDSAGDVVASTRSTCTS